MPKFRITYKYDTGPEFVITVEIEGAPTPQEANYKLSNQQQFPFLAGKITIIRVEKLDQT